MRTTIWAGTGAWVLFGLLVPAPLMAGDEAERDKSAEEKTTATVANLQIKGSLPETSGKGGLFSKIEVNLRELTRRLEQAAEDEEVEAVVVSIRTPSIGRGKIQELRGALSRLRQSGKRVVAQLQSARTVDYLLATACDEIVMPESGVLMMPGVRAEVTFFKGLFDKLGIEPDLMQVGDFKGAAESYTRKEMSSEFREQYELLVDDLYEQLVETVAADRELEPERVRELIDVGIFTPAEAAEAGLIDRISYDSRQEKHWKARLGVESVKMVQNYGKEKVDNEFSGMMGMMKLFELMMGGKEKERSGAKKKVALIYASGVITPGKSTTSMFGEEALGSDTLVEAIHKAGRDDKVVAIVLRVDSPGGSSLASDLVWNAVRKCEKPIIASMGDVAASGGYYISMACDRIFAEPATLTGSIGVVGGKLAMGGLYDKVGISTEVISRGKNSGILSADDPFTDSERKAWKKMMKEVYRQFVAKAAEGREMEVAELDKLAGGRIWTGRQAQQRGLVDELGTLSDAIEVAKKTAGVGEDEETELLILPRPSTFFERVFGDEVASGAWTATASALPSELRRQAAELHWLKELFDEPALFLMPHRVKIR